MPIRFRTLGTPLAGVLLLMMLPASASAYFAHVVAPGESLTSVAAADGLSVSALAAANGISPDSLLVSGSVLQIPPQTPYTSAGSPAVAQTPVSTDEAEPATTSPYTSTAATGGGYVVQPGDTLSAIAARAGTSVAELAALNGLDPQGLLYAGSALRLPGAGATTEYVSTTTSSAGAATAESQPVGAAAEGNPSAGPYPTAERVSGSQIASIASAEGVPPALAQAVGWQESGWNNDEVSVDGAVGVMQILPGTWNWIQRTLTAGTSLAPASATDNVRGGVLLLHSLLAATGSSAMAAAGYYQGLSSVQQHGMYADTQQYVNDVLSLERQFGGG
jgi:LysM repeat protein